mmetsp:Transcript_13035/g.19507  ORF Transcript_13035/g.19507 Transcript_13035/m.19507 type:complete len:167 (+) Transcript_13035:132-632(+)
MQDNWSSTSASSTAPSTPTQRKKRVPLIRRFLVLLILLASFLLFCVAQIFNPYLIPALDRIVISRAPFNICHEKYSYSQDANGEQGMGHKRRRAISRGVWQGYTCEEIKMGRHCPLLVGTRTGTRKMAMRCYVICAKCINDFGVISERIKYISIASIGGIMPNSPM